MDTLSLEGVAVAGICACLPERTEDCAARCAELLGSAEKARDIVRATGIRSRRILSPGVTALDLCVAAARRVLSDTGTDASEIGAVVCVTFTSERLMPCNACQAQARLGLRTDVVAFDIGLACSGWLYGVYVAGLLAKSLNRKVLLLDGDSQSRRTDGADASTVPLLSDAGTATLLDPTCAVAEQIVFAFLSDGAKGGALQLPFGGTIAMDGFAVFRFVSVDVLKFLQSFMAERGREAAGFDAFVPHQANVYLVRQLAKRLGFDGGRLKISADVLGNCASASVPVTIVRSGARGKLLAAGYGGGLSAAVAELPIPTACILSDLVYCPT